MKRAPEDKDMLEEYDFSKGIRGKYAKKIRGRDKCRRHRA